VLYAGREFVEVDVAAEMVTRLSLYLVTQPV
jgi:ribosomal protein S19